MISFSLPLFWTIAPLLTIAVLWILRLSESVHSHELKLLEVKDDLHYIRDRVDRLIAHDLTDTR